MVDCREQFQEKCAAVFRPKLRNAGFDRFLEVEHVIAGYGYTLGKSVALALLDDGFAGEGTELSVHIVGVERLARGPRLTTPKARRCGNEDEPP